MYKRQTLLEALLYFMLNEGNEKIDEEEHNAVSYTHLDVYKRQVSILTGQTAVDRRAVNLVCHKNNLRFSVWCGTSNQKDEGLSLIHISI